MSDHDNEGTMDLQSVSDPVEDEASAPPAIVPGDGGDSSGGRPRPKWLVPVIAAFVAAVVAVAGLVGWRVFESHRHDAALDSCSRAVKAVQGKTSSGRMAQYREAAGIKADQVKDAKTVLAMARSVKDAEGLKRQTVQCKASMSTADLNAEAGKARRIDSRFAVVAKSAQAVLVSRDAKVLDDAKTALDGKKGEASKLLADSDGKVADNATRDGLQKAIDQAGQVRSGKAKAYQDAADALQAAIDQVNASVQAKSQADQQAAAQAAQAQAAQQAAPSNNSRGGYTPSYRPSVNRGGGGGGYTPAPAPAAPSAPQGGGGSGIDWDQWVQDHQTPSQCHAGGSCPIG
ncbi:hypothetical protein QRX46_07090 [Bifidobacterium sp. H1HS10N]|uniref:hypothetical protein n=1 Tax=Bifidobacterium kimbladii TaxID=1293826 RepID=UPI0028BF3472|nr:hypothetical protein [Bifidobacterium sp. H1HS10N]MDT7513180.1 hypothetical protein [Bifidobacterium sp. H1HS10N]